MSEERKKTLRTQGKYSEKTREKRQKDSPGEREPPEKKPQNRDSNGYQSNTSHDGNESELAVKYQDNSSYSFEALNVKKEPIEIREPGQLILSETANGQSKIIYEPHFMTEKDACDDFHSLSDSTVWNEKNIVINGKEFPQPRLVAWYGPFPYSYSGVILEPKEMPEDVVRIKCSVEECLFVKYGINITFNSVLLNWYKDGKNSVAWHSDDEMSMGIHPTIASVSLGETRRFEMKRKVESYGEEIYDDQVDQCFINLTTGSLLIMDGCMQQDWLHRVPKEYHHRNGRINLTFRTVYSLDNVSSEMPAKGYKNNQRTSALHTAPDYDENIPLKGSYDENFPSLGNSSATSTVFEPETSDHEMDVENSLPNKTSSSLVCSDIKSNICESFENSKMSEDYGDSTKYSNDNSQNFNTCVDANTNNIKCEKPLFEHEVNKDAQASNLLSDSSIMNPDESFDIDKSGPENTLSVKHVYVSQDHLNQLCGNESDASGQNVINSNLNVNAKEFFPMSPPASEEHKEKFAPSAMSSPVSEECKYGSYSLEELFRCETNHMNLNDFYYYAYQLKHEISKRLKEFGKGSRQLEFLCDLMEEDLPERCQKKITARMLDISKIHHNKTCDNDRFNSKNFTNKQWGNQRRERSYSSQGSRFQDKPYRDSESGGQRYVKRQNFHREEVYNEKDNFSEQHSEGNRVERGNSNRGGISKRGNFNRESNSRGRTSEGYNERVNFSEQHSEDKSVERGHSNRRHISKRENFNREGSARGGTSRDGRYLAEVGRGESHKWGI